jgi:hypothetical protein
MLQSRETGKQVALQLSRTAGVGGCSIQTEEPAGKETEEKIETQILTAGMKKDIGYEMVRGKMVEI